MSSHAITLLNFCFRFARTNSPIVKTGYRLGLFGKNSFLSYCLLKCLSVVAHIWLMNVKQNFFKKEISLKSCPHDIVCTTKNGVRDAEGFLWNLHSSHTPSTPPSSPHTPTCPSSCASDVTRHQLATNLNTNSCIPDEMLTFDFCKFPDKYLSLSNFTLCHFLTVFLTYLSRYVTDSWKCQDKTS